MRSFKHATMAASADSRIASQHAHHHGAGTEMSVHELQAHRPQLAHHSSSQFSQSHAYQQTTTTSQQQLQQQSYQQSNQSSYGGPIQYHNGCNAQQQQGYQQSFQPPYGAPNQHNNNAIYQQQQQQQYNQKAQPQSQTSKLSTTPCSPQISVATAPQPPYNVQDTTEYPLPPVGSYMEPNVDVTDPDYNPSGEGTMDRQDYGSAATYQHTTTADPSISATQGNQTTSDQSQPQQMMNVSASSVPADEDVGYQTASAMDTTTTSAQPDQTTINDNCCNNDDGGRFTCLSQCCCSKLLLTGLGLVCCAKGYQ